MANKIETKDKIKALKAQEAGASQRAKTSNEAKKGTLSKETKKRAEKQGKKNHKKALIIGGAVGAGLLVVGVGAAITVPALLQPKYGESYELAVDIKEWLDDLYDEKKAHCRDVIDNVADESVGIESFEKMVDSCQADLVEVRDLIERLGATSGIEKDENLKKKYDKFTKTAESTMPTDEKMKSQFKAYLAVHEFEVRLDKLDTDDFNEESIKTIAKILIDSGDDTLEEIGEGFEQRAIKIVKLYEQAEAAIDAGDYSEYVRLYSEASDVADEYGDWMDDQRDVLNNKDWMLDEDSIETMRNDFDALYKSIREMYEKHYDGKNEVECSDKGNGVVKCK